MLLIEAYKVHCNIITKMSVKRRFICQDPKSDSQRFITETRETFAVKGAARCSMNT